MKIKSETKEEYYEIQKLGQYYICSCPSFKYTAKPCKHIKKIMNEGTSMNETKGIIQAKSERGIKINDNWYNLKVPTNVTNFEQAYKGKNVQVFWEEIQGTKYIEELILEQSYEQQIQKKIVRQSSIKTASTIAGILNIKTETEFLELAQKIENWINR